MRVTDLGTWTLLACALVLSAPGPTRAQSPEEQRRRLQERLGIKPPSAQQVPDAGVVAPGTLSPTEATRAPAAPPARTPAVASRPRVPGFAEDARPILEKACGNCHGPEGMASRSRWVLRGEPADYEATLRFVQPATAAQSPLLKKGTGTTLHGGKKVLAVESAQYATLLRWIEGGAPPGKARGALATAEAVPGAPRPPHAGTSAPSAPSTAATASGVAASPVPSAPSSASASAGPTPTLPSASTGSVPQPTPRANDAMAASAGPTSAPPAASASAGPTPTLPASPSSGASAAPRFAPGVHEALLADCSSCHASDGMAAASRYVTHPDPEQHLRSVTPLVVPGAAANSLLYQRARGEAHPGGEVWPPGSAQLALLAQWIDAGATGTPPPAAGSTAVATAPPV
ncbi:hypothetical protein HNS30_33260, partial [Corallococcus exercitus]|nr:hypothetical protein [Corallococcus exercitus]